MNSAWKQQLRPLVKRLPSASSSHPIQFVFQSAKGVSWLFFRAHRGDTAGCIPLQVSHFLLHVHDL